MSSAEVSLHYDNVVASLHRHSTCGIVRHLTSEAVGHKLHASVLTKAYPCHVGFGVRLLVVTAEKQLAKVHLTG